MTSPSRRSGTRVGHKQPARRRAWLLAVALLTHAACAAPVSGAPAEPSAQAVRTGSVSTVAATATGVNGRAAVTLEAPSDKGLTVQAGKTFWYDRASAKPAPAARWTNLSSGEGPDANGLFNLPAKATATFQVEGAFEQAGVYESYLQIEGGDGISPQRFTIVITRTVRDLPADLLRDLRVAQFELGLRRPAVEDRQVRVTARNGTAELVELGASSAGAIYRTDEAGETAVGGTANLGPVADHCPNPLSPGATCDLLLTLPQDLGPGKYALELALNGKQSGQSAKTMKFQVRASPWLAAALVMIGALAGALVSYWREKGSYLADQLVAAAETRTLLATLAHAPPTRALAAAARELRMDAGKLEEDISRGGDRQVALADLTKRAAALAKADAAIRSISGENQAMLADLAARIDALVSWSNWKSDDLDMASGALRAELEAVGALSNALKAAKELDARLQQLGGWPGGAGAEARIALQQKMAQACDSVPVPAQRPGQGTGDYSAVLALRAEALRQTCRELESSQPRAALDALRASVDTKAAAQPPPAKKAELEAFSKKIAAAKAPSIEDAARLIGEAQLLDVHEGIPGGNLETAVAGGALVVPTISSADTKAILKMDASLLGFGAGQSVRSLRTKQGVWNIVTNVLVLLVIGAVGVLAVWLPNTAWGTTFDIIMAFLAGVGTRLAIGALPGAPAR